jgi:hypothetical protein
MNVPHHAHVGAAPAAPASGQPSTTSPSPQTVAYAEEAPAGGVVSTVAAAVSSGTSMVSSAIHWTVFGFGVYGIYRFATREKSA